MKTQISIRLNDVEHDYLKSISDAHGGIAHAVRHILNRARQDEVGDKKILSSIENLRAEAEKSKAEIVALINKLAD